MAEGVGLTAVPQVESGIRRGRNVQEGYVRACNLQFADLLGRLRDDPLYMRCLALAEGRTLVTEEKLANLYLLLRNHLPQLESGHIVEFGTYRGGSALFMAALADELLPGCRVYGFDSFAGMPPTDRAVDLHQEGDFADVDLAELRGFAAAKGLRNIEFVPGLFEDSFPGAAAAVGRIALCHIDCDIRAAVAYAYDASRSLMVTGGYWVFDDPLVASCVGATEAVEELVIQRDGLFSEQVYPHLVFRAGFDMGEPSPVRRLEAELAALRASRSWRLTAPLR